MDDLLKKLGYQINQSVLEQEYHDITGEPINPKIQRWIEAVSPYVAAAYQKGIANEPIGTIFPFLEKVDAKEGSHSHGHFCP